MRGAPKDLLQCDSGVGHFVDVSDGEDGWGLRDQNHSWTLQVIADFELDECARLTIRSCLLWHRFKRVRAAFSHAKYRTRTRAKARNTCLV